MTQDIGRNDRSGASNSSTRDELTHDAQQLGSKARQRAEQAADQQKHAVSDQAESVSSALRSAAEDDGAPSWLSSAFRNAADQVQRLAQDLEGKSSRELVHDLNGFARQNPGAFLAASAAAGFAAARLFRIGQESHSDHGGTARGAGGASYAGGDGETAGQPTETGPYEPVHSAGPIAGSSSSLQTGVMP